MITWERTREEAGRDGARPLPEFSPARSGLLSRFLSFRSLQGDCDLQLLSDRLTKPVVEPLYGGVQVRCGVPFLNRGDQKGMVIEFLCRPEYWGPATRDVFVAPRVHWVGVREDGYWPAVFIEPLQEVQLEIMVGIFGARPAVLSLLGLPRLPLLVYYKVMGRAGIQWRVAQLPIALAGRKRLTANGWMAYGNSHPHPDHHAR